jgi:hypothetical protein
VLYFGITDSDPSGAGAESEFGSRLYRESLMAKQSAQSLAPRCARCHFAMAFVTINRDPKHCRRVSLFECSACQITYMIEEK